MKIFHLSDLHIGKKLKEYSMLENQKYVLSQVYEICDGEEIDCVVIAGDIYDKTVPPAEAVQVFDDFLYKLTQKNIPVLIISGNHDSAERISFGGRVMSAGGVYIAPVYNGKIQLVILSDEHGEVNFYLLPFIKPSNVRGFYPDRKIESFTEALEAVIGDIEIDDAKRNILVTHQFVTGSQLSKSEEFFVGGTENVDCGILDTFDYVALGHIHRPQFVGSSKIRYCGSQLKYHIDEVNQEKSFTIADIDENGNVSIKEIPIKPLRDVKSYKGTYEQLTDKNFYSNINTEDYIYITLTDEADIPDGARKLKKVYPNLLQLFYDNSRTRKNNVILSDVRNEKMPPIDIFSEFFELKCNRKMTDEQKEFMDSLIKSVWEEEIL
ncbi:MAG: exonuclease SbcCD subunit D [Ruminococcus sp.]|nr:exonuclease SbcCD subunit D [Ruminococcus sp.]